MCGDQGVWLFPPSCSLIPGGVLEDFSQQENKQEKPKGTDRVFPQQPADLQGSGYHTQRQAPGISRTSHSISGPSSCFASRWQCGSLQRAETAILPGKRGELQIRSGTPGRPQEISDTGAATWLPLSVPRKLTVRSPRL